MKTLSRIPLIAAVALAGAALNFGCSAAKSVVNSNVPPVNDGLHINGRSVRALVSRAVTKPSATRAAIPGAGSLSDTFNDSGIDQADKFTFAKFEQSVSKDVLVRFPGGAAQPANFAVSGLVLRVTLSEKDANSQPTRSLTVAGLTSSGPFVFAKVRDNGDGSAAYTLSNVSGISLSEVQIGKDDTKTLTNILSEPDSLGSDRNYVDAQFGFDTDDTQLPEGTTVDFTFADGQARVGI